jgi:hypothetical protein
VIAPFGYIKGPDVNGHLLLDEETCGYARQIFGWAADGRSISYIKRRIPYPTWWNRPMGLRSAHTPILIFSIYEPLLKCKVF